LVLFGIGMSRLYSFQRPGAYALAGANLRSIRSFRAKKP
jgi:hypothetical protein